MIKSEVDCSSKAKCYNVRDVFLFIGTVDIRDMGTYMYRGLNVKQTVFILLLFASLRDCGQNQTAVSDKQYSLFDFQHDQGCPIVVNFHFD